MSLDLNWFKYTGLGAVQSAAHAILGALGGNVLDVWHLNYQSVAGIGLGAALVSVLGAVVAYKLPEGTATASVSTAADAAANTDTTPPAASRIAG